VTRAGRRVAIPIDQLITSRHGAALIFDSRINLPGLERRELQAAARDVGNQPNDDAPERAILGRYAATRTVQGRDRRNDSIDAQGLSRDRGSFAGW
jgi:hypothetical protein